jgi:UV DNA damage endonuclease
MNIRLGLCCIFKAEPIKFRTVTYANLKKEHITNSQPYHYLSQIIEHNCLSLRQAIQFCADNGIGSFRVNSQFFPLATHPEVAYTIERLPQAENILKLLQDCKNLAQELNIRLTLHPDQFILLNSPSQEVLKASLLELEYQNDLATKIGADVIIIHAGGVYGDKKTALERLELQLEILPTSLKQKLTLENDDRLYSPQDLLPLCLKYQIPLIYDVHHHRCHPDELNVEQATELACSTWNREPLFHLSSPIDGWGNLKSARKHHDLIDLADFPMQWKTLPALTIEIEAKAKEVAIAQLIQDLKLK